MDEKFFTPEQVADILQVHPYTVLKFIRQGKLKAVKLGRVYRIKQSEVENFLEAQTLGGKKLPSNPKKDELDNSEKGLEMRNKKSEATISPDPHNPVDHYIIG